MKKTFWIISAVIWICSISLLVISLTNLLPDNRLQGYKILLGLIFILISGLIGIGYRTLYK